MPVGRVYAQTTFCGQVTDSTGCGVPFVQVMLQPEGKKSIVAYTQSDVNGKYRFNAFTAGKYSLNFRALSFAPHSKAVEVLPDTAITTTIDVQLHSRSFAINEVIVQSERPITIKEDTVIFKTMAFKQGNEQVAEDVLKKLPGIDVSDNGAITWQGKPIEKVMVEGEDLFGKGYRIITKNMQANTIDKVEVYERYSNNPLLKGIEESDKVALNLTLSKEKRFATFGNVELGYATNSSYKANGSLMSLGKNVKGFLFANANSIGHDPMGEIAYIVNSGSNQDDEAYQNIEANHQIGLRGYSPNLGSSRVADSKSAMISANGIINISPKTTLKVVTLGAINNQNHLNEGYTKYFLTDTTYTNTESKSTGIGINNGLGRLELRHKPSSNALLDYVGQLYYSTEESSSNLIYNSTPTSENLNNEQFSTNHALNYTNKISSKTALQVMARYRFSNSPERYGVSRFYLYELFPQHVGSSGQRQLICTRTSDFMFSSKLITRPVERWTLDFGIGANFGSSRLKSELFATDSLDVSTQISPNNFGNNLAYSALHLLASTNATRKIGDFMVIISADANQTWTKLGGTNQTLSYIQPNAGISWIPNSNNKLQLLYMLSANELSIADISTGYISTSYNYLSRGYGKVDVFKVHSAFLSYNHGQVMDRFFLQSSVLYSHSVNPLVGSSQIFPTYYLSSIVRGNAQDMLMASITSDLYIDKAQSNIKLRCSYSLNDYQYMLNGELANSQQQTLTYGGELRSAFDGFFNFHLGTNWTSIDLKNTDDGQYQNNNQFLDFLFSFGTKLTAEINIERFYFGRIQSPDNPWYFVDFNAKYQCIPNRLTLTLSGNNILNNSVFGIFSKTNIIESATTYRIAPRYVMLSVYLRF